MFRVTKQRVVLWGYLGLIAILLFAIGILFDVRRARRTSEFLQQWAKQLVINRNSDVLVSRLLQRVTLYETEIKKISLLDGMIVSRTFNGEYKDECDSLLFSAIHYVALEKLGDRLAAAEAWRAIEQSQNDGRWHRHPRCKHPISRDMILGVIIALTQNPDHSFNHISSFLRQLHAHDGFVAHGPVDVSFLSPGLVELMRMLALQNGITSVQLPSVTNNGFSTLEFDALGVQRGYVSHLLALTVWAELELGNNYENENLRRPRVDLSGFEQFFGAKNLSEVRYQWITDRLIETDPQNLFFRWLRLKNAGALTVEARLVLIDELLEMSAFPDHRLPTNCDRKADYLWQRHSAEYTPRTNECRYIFPGVDFMWMAALLLTDPIDLREIVEPYRSRRKLGSIDF